MATTTTYHAQLIKYTASGDQYILNLKNTGDDVSISRSSNGNLPTTVTSAQTLANALGSLAFKSSITASNIASGEITSSLNITAAGKIADASALKVLNDKITTNANNITKLNSNLVSVTLTTASWSGSSAPFTYTISNSKIYGSNTNVILSLPTSMTTDQRSAYKKAQIESGVVSSGKVVLYAYGVKPTINIPIQLSIGGGY